MNRSRKLLLTLGAALLCCGVRGAEHSPRLAEALAGLDAAIESRANYETIKLTHIRQLEQMYTSNNASPEQRYQMGLSLYEEYEGYQFDKAQSYLQQNLELAERMGDREKIAETLIVLGHLYASAGFYLEAQDILDNRIDEQALSKELRLRYFLAQQKLNNELINFSKLESTVVQAVGKARIYTDRLLAELPPESFDYRTLYIVNGLSQWKLDQAEQMCLKVLDDTADSPRQFALAAYLEAVLCSMQGRNDEMAYWYARSATADIQASVRDNASIYCLSTYLFGLHDIRRALRYVRISMEDASFYNAKLRQWQIASYMTTIEQAAQEIEDRRIRQMHLFSLVILVLAGSLLLALLYLAKLYRTTHRDKQMLSRQHEQLSDFNRQLSEFNRAIVEANHVKEEYIGLFLTMCSSYIDKLSDMQRTIRRRLSRGEARQLEQELKGTNIADEELKSFYETFDNAFLHLYPSFVEDFNSLLLDDERIVPRDERLNTELRIFALIRLGITDSSKIASMLHYSVNTIYNYRAKVKNKSKCPRENFEEAVRHIGSFTL